MRLRQLEGGATQKANLTPKKADQQAYRKPQSIRSYNAEADVSMDGNGVEEKTAKVEDSNGAGEGERKKEKKEKKRKIEEVTAPVEGGDDGEVEEEKPKKKKEKKEKRRDKE